MSFHRFTNRINQNKNKSNILYKQQNSNLFFNIVIRFDHSVQPNSFSNCINSILKQGFQQYNIFVIITDAKCYPFLKEFTNKITVVFLRTNTTREGYKNLYFNNIFKKINKGWIIFLDHYNKFHSHTVLYTLFDTITSDNSFCIWKYNKDDKIIFNRTTKNMDLCCVAFHHKSIKGIHFLPGKNNVEVFLNKLIQTNRFEFKLINKVLVSKIKKDEKENNRSGNDIVNDIKKEIAVNKNLQKNSDKKITIVMAYYNRKQQLLLTLKQFSKLYNTYNLDIIIVDDCSDDEHTINDLCELFPSLTLKLIKLTNKTWINPVVPFNKGILNISDDTDFVLFQSPEIFHCSDIISHVGGNLNDTNYLTYPVFNSYDYAMNDTVEKLFESNCDDYYDAFISKVDINIADKRTDYYRWKGWLNHKLYNNRKLHFLSAITKKNLDKIGGLCNAMKDGYSYDDNDFLHRISQVCNPMTVDSNKFIGIHLKHDCGTYNMHTNPNYKSLIETNLTIFKNNMDNNIIYCDPNETVAKKTVPIHISIVMAYYNRKPQTLETLRCFEKMYAGKYDFEVVIVDDNSNDENRLEEDIKQFTFPINLIVISAEDINKDTAYNLGFAETKGDIIMIQNPECYHDYDIIEHTNNTLTEQKCNTYMNDSTLSCISIHKNKLELMGGVDSRFREKAYQIKHLLICIKHNLKLDIDNYTSNLQKSTFNKPFTNQNTDDTLYNSVKNIHERNDFVYPKILFLYWDGSPLSYLNYLTVISFNKHNPEWKIVIYQPSKQTTENSWVTDEQKEKYTGKDYFYKLYDVNNVTILKVCLDDIGFYSDASEVIKSDYFRYYFLEKHGGLWSDFDILYTASIEEKMNFKENSVIFHCTGYHDLNNKKDSPTFKYYPIGMFLTKPKSKLFKFILENTYKYYDQYAYQCIGASMWNDLFKQYSNVYKIDESVKILDNTYYLPWQCNELEEFIVKKYNILPTTNVGIHWFNGGNLSKKYSIDLSKRITNFKIKCYLDIIIMKYFNKNICLFSESSYPGGGGEEFLYDLAIYFTNHNYNVFWITLHDWGKSQHSNETIIKNDFYTEILVPRKINDLSNYDYFINKLKQFNINYLIQQGRGHKLICDIGNKLNIPTITFWCFWEEAIDIDWDYGLININKHLDKHKKNIDFKYILDNIDYFYFASRFVKETIEKKYNIKINDEHIFPTLSNDIRFIKDYSIDSFNSKYVTLLDAHTFKGADILSELILLNPNVSFLAIKTEDEENGPELIVKSMKQINNQNNKILFERENNVKKIYNQTKILLCPTRLDETFCRVVYEAFQNKIPVIFSNCGNLGFIKEPNLLCIKEHNVNNYHNALNKLLNDKAYYQEIVDLQYNYYLTTKRKSSLSLIATKLLSIENNKNKHIGIFTPWCDQGLGIQSRIYKYLLEKMGYKCFIFSTKPYVKTDKANLISNNNEWKTSNIYKSPNKRLEISFRELDLFVLNYKIKKMIIPEIQYDIMFKIPLYLREKYDIPSYAIPNIETIRKHELEKFNVFENVLVNNKMSYNILKNKGLNNISFLGFYYTVPPQIKFKKINKDKKINETIQILHLTGLNGLFRKRTDVIVNMFEKLYNEGINFKLNIVIQGNFDNNKKNIFNKPFINIIDNHISYSEILNLYNENHISLQLSKHEGLGLGFYESCYMNTPVITLDAAPHNEVIHHKKNGWLLSCTLERDKTPENPFTIIEQTQIDEEIIYKEIKEILLNKEEINKIIKTTKAYIEKTHSYDQFENNIKSLF